MSCKALFESCETVTRIHPLRHEYCVQDLSVSEKCVNHLPMSNPPGASSNSAVVRDTQGYRGYHNLHCSPAVVLWILSSCWPCYIWAGPSILRDHLERKLPLKVGKLLKLWMASTQVWMILLTASLPKLPAYKCHTSVWSYKIKHTQNTRWHFIFWLTASTNKEALERWGI